MSLLVRTWNLFHGRTSPPSRENHLERMVRVVSEDAPALVALQEVPVWALGRLAGWSGMRAFGAVTMPALAGPAARAVTALDPLRFRSLLTGQANAVLVGEDLDVVAGPFTSVLNDRSFRREEARRLTLPRRDRFAWAWNRRVCQSLRVGRPGGELLFANVHATSHADPRLARAEVERVARAFGREAALVLCGDLNAPFFSPTGFSEPLRRIDQILVRGLSFERRPAPWPEERRRYAGRVLSDHAPVEAVIA